MLASPYFSSVGPAPCHRRTSVEFAVIRDDKHDLPLEDVVIHQSTTYPRYILVGLHLFELAGQEAGGGPVRRHGFAELGVFVCEAVC